MLSVQHEDLSAIPQQTHTKKGRAREIGGGVRKERREIERRKKEKEGRKEGTTGKAGLAVWKQEDPWS